MPAATTHGYPYALPADPVRDGAGAIQALATANEARAPIRAGQWTFGGYTTNQYGGIDLAVGFTVVGAVAITGNAGYMIVHPQGAPAGQLWLDVFGSTGQPVPNTFIIFNFIAWG
jgi:hypothetical protein